MKKIYIIDDDTDFASGLSAYFEDSGFSVKIIPDEIKGIELINKHIPDIVFLDLGLKNVCGIEVLKQIKKDHPFLPVIIISGTEILNEAVEAVKQGADDFISKPILELEKVEICVESVCEKNRLKMELDEYKRNLENIIKSRTNELKEKTIALEKANKTLTDEIEKRIAAEEYIKRGSLNIINTLEEERKRLSLELHDSIGQKLMFTKINLEMFEKESSKGNPHLNNAKETINQMGEEIRLIIKSLYPQSIDKYPLIQNLKTLIKNFEKLSEIKYTFEFSGKDIDMDPKSKLNIYRIFQEAFNNIVKHSNARNVDIKINICESFLNAEISDDGNGFEISKNISGKNGTGLFSMKERIKQLNGKINLSSVAGNGTKINLEIPTGNI